MVNPNYREINAKEQLSREDSVLRYYRKLIALRKKYEIIVYGNYDLLLPESQEIYAYTRTLGDEKLLVVCNFSAKEVACEIPAAFTHGKILIQNYEDVNLETGVALRPYESFVIWTS